jgi:hypothetical protein
LLTRQTFNKSQESFANIASQLQRRLESLVFKKSPNNNKERSCLLDNISASKQCLKICKIASKVSSQKVYKLREVIAENNSDQVVANTLADLFNVKKAISKDNSAQLLRSMSGEDLQFLAEKRYESRFGAFNPGPNPVNQPIQVRNTEEEILSTLHRTNPLNQSQSKPNREKASPNEIRKRTD